MKVYDHMQGHEEFVTLKEAASRLNLHYHQLQRAAKKGMFPSYAPFGNRRYVRISEVVAAIEAARGKHNGEA
jgi:excisionase family DNA binding protein